MRPWEGFNVAEFLKGLAEGLTQNIIMFLVLSYHALGQAHLILIPILYEKHKVQRD